MKELRTLALVLDGRGVPFNDRHARIITEAIDQGLVDVVAMQGNGMDSGPYYLGADCGFPGVRECLEVILLGAKRKGIPFVMSMGGPAGADIHLSVYLDQVDEICRRNKIQIKAAVIHGEIEKEYLKAKIHQGVKIRRAFEIPRLREYLNVDDVNKAKRIQAQMGPETIMSALELGVDGVFTGRALDVGVFMAFPLKMGFDRALAAHGGKVVECGGLVIDPQGYASDAVIWTLKEDHFLVRPADPNLRCTVKSVLGHSLYEREEAFAERNPGGVLNIGNAKYEQIDERTVKCYGAEWKPVPYTVKLEGVEPIGYQNVSILAIRDFAMIKHLDRILDEAEKYLAQTPAAKSANYQINYHVFGRDGVLGISEPLRGTVTPHEVAIYVSVTAPTQEQADSLANQFRITMFFANFPGRTSTAGNTAQPMQPQSVPIGEAYVFNIWHLLPLDDPCEPFRREVVSFPRT